MDQSERSVEAAAVDMEIRKFSMIMDAETSLSENFKVKEFAQKDGKCDTVLVDRALVALCQSVRDYFQKPVTVHSGYRSAKYNAACGGARNSLHLTGRAADIRVKDVHPIAVALYAQDELAAPGIGLYAYPLSSAGFVHIDTRPSGNGWRGLQTSPGGGCDTLRGFFPVLRSGARGNAVVLLQRLLGIKDDGWFGPATLRALAEFQRRMKLDDGEAACPNTWAALARAV